VLRAGLWLGVFFLALAIAVAVSGAWPAMQVRLESSAFAVELTATFLTGATAVLAAFLVSMPDRSRLWLLLPLPVLILWLGTSSYGCYRHLTEAGPDGWTLGQSRDCFIFIITLSIPLAGTLLWMLRRACPLDARAVLLAGGLGVAALSAAALQFFHPFDVTFLDLGVHLLAMGGVILLVAALGRRPLAAG
jgi:hypothetical protein